MIQITKFSSGHGTLEVISGALKRCFYPKNNRVDEAIDKSGDKNQLESAAQRTEIRIHIHNIKGLQFFHTI